MLLQRQKLADKLCVIQELEEKLTSKTRAHDKGCQTIQLLLIKTRELDTKIEELQSKKVSFHCGECQTAIFGLGNPKCTTTNSFSIFA